MKCVLMRPDGTCAIDPSEAYSLREVTIGNTQTAEFMRETVYELSHRDAQCITLSLPHTTCKPLCAVSGDGGVKAGGSFFPVEKGTSPSVQGGVEQATLQGPPSPCIAIRLLQLSYVYMWLDGELLPQWSEGGGPSSALMVHGCGDGRGAVGGGGLHVDPATTVVDWGVGGGAGSRLFHGRLKIAEDERGDGRQSHNSQQYCYFEACRRDFCLLTEVAMIDVLLPEIE
eukprot:6193108-Pleurochrysis_carterae.AAC.1